MNINVNVTLKIVSDTAIGALLTAASEAASAVHQPAKKPVDEPTKLPETPKILDDVATTNTSTVKLRGKNDSGHVNRGPLHKRELNCLDLLEILDYDRENGLVFWKPRTPEMYGSYSNGNTYEGRAHTFNKKYAGKEALTTISNNGFRTGKIFNNSYQLSSVVWCMETGEWPASNLRFRDCNPLNTKFENLIQMTDCQDYGISKHPSGRYKICLEADNDRFPKRYYDKKEDAIRVRDQIMGRLPVDETPVASPVASPVQNGHVNAGPLEHRQIDYIDLQELLEYDRENGRLFWKPRTGDMYEDSMKATAEQKAARFNKRCAGKEALASVTLGTFKSGPIGGTTYHANRVVWCLETGEWPNGKLTARDGNRLNCRFENLTLT